MTRRRWIGLAAVAALVLLGGRFGAGMYVEHRWYAILGDGPLAVWRARLIDLVAVRLVLTLAASAFLFANLYGVSTSVDSLVLPRRLGDLEIGEKVPGRRLLWAAGVLALIAGAALSFLVDDWMSFDLVQFARDFGVPEPYTNVDLGFFLYWLPFENALYFWAIGVLLATGSLVVLLYVLTAGLRVEGGRLRTTRHVRRHFAALAAGLLLVLAWGHRLDAYTLLWNGGGDDGAFTVLDHEIVLRSRFLIATITAVASLVVLRAGWQGQARLTFWVVSIVIGATALLRGIVPAVQARLVAPEEFARRNAPYARNRAGLTQTAYGVNRIQRVPVGYGLSDASDAGARLPLWDPLALARSIERQRRGEIVVGEIGWQAIGSQLAAVAVTRPAPPPELEPRAWHVVAASAVSADAVGEAVLVADSAGAPRVAPDTRERRLLVFPQATGYAIIRDTTGRLAADPIRSFWSRLAHAWDQRDLRLMLDDEIGAATNPVIVLRRSVSERIEAVAPFFARGRAITPLVAQDTLFWACHLYSASESFPLSQRYLVGGATWGYFHHAGVAIVNAETGALSIVADPAPDRLTEAWVRRFPTLFTSPSTLPDELTAAIPPATDGVMVQAWALSQYGSRADFTAGTVHVPGGEGGDSTIGVGARSLASLPAATPGGGSAPGWTMPLLDSADRISGLLVALGGARPSTVWVPNGEAGPRWADVAERLRGATSVAAAPSNEEVVRGRVHVAPVGSRLAFVQSAYRVEGEGRANFTSVTGLIDDSLRVGRTVGDALGASAPPPSVARPSTPLATVSASQRTRSLYEAMRAALRRGDWAAFGAAFDSLGAVLARTPR